MQLFEIEIKHAYVRSKSGMCRSLLDPCGPCCLNGVLGCTAAVVQTAAAVHAAADFFTEAICVRIVTVYVVIELSRLFFIS